MARMARGIPLPRGQAARHATKEILRWLVADYGLDPVGARILLGQVDEYDVANFYNPAYSVVCKVPKQYLRQKEE
jgi:hypothetical protein